MLQHAAALFLFDFVCPSGATLWGRLPGVVADADYGSLGPPEDADPHGAAFFNAIASPGTGQNITDKLTQFPVADSPINTSDELSPKGLYDEQTHGTQTMTAERGYTPMEQLQRDLDVPDQYWRSPVNLTDYMLAKPAFTFVTPEIDGERLEREDAGDALNVTAKNIDHASWQATTFTQQVDVTDALNALVAENGIHDFTAGRSLTEIFGDVDPGKEKSLRVERHSRFMDIPEGDVFEYSLGPLFSQEQRVDGAFYMSLGTDGKFANVTTEVNELIAANGIDDITAHQSLSAVLADPAPGEGKMLRAVVGSRVLDLPEPARGGPPDLVYKLTPLFVETGRIAPKKDRVSLKSSPSVFVTVFSRRAAVMRRSFIRDMWMRAAGTSGNVTVKFTLCDGDDDWSTPIDYEHKIHGDILVLQCEEGYGKGLLTKKVLASMRFFIQLERPPTLFMKIDDDTFVSWYYLANFLVTYGHEQAYMGIPIGEAQPCRNETYQWYEPYDTWSEPVFPEAMAGGSGYVLGRTLVREILEQNIGEQHVLWNEDRAVGVWISMLRKAGINAEHVAIPGADGFWAWDWKQPKKNWNYWAEYPHLVHHGLHAETIACLSQAEMAGDPWRPLRGCFDAEVGETHQVLSCTGK